MAGKSTNEPGDRDRLVTIQQRGGDAVDDEGFPLSSWVDLVEAFMAKRDASARERMSRDQLSASFDSVFQMNYRDDMDPELVDVPKLRRLIYQGRTYDIVAASQIGRRDGIELQTLAQSRV